MDVKFTKMHGSGNDFIVVDEWAKEALPDGRKVAFVKMACDRHFGVGSDGAIFVQKSKKADVNFVYYNPDGSKAEMCGNGIRCLAKYVYEHGLVKKKTMTAETLTGIKSLDLTVDNSIVKEVKVDMGRPQVKRGEAQVSGDPEDTFINQIVEVGDSEYKITAVGMGNPHAIVLHQSIDAVDLTEACPKIRHYASLFPKGVNVHFIQKTGPNEFKIRTYERGVEAETLACGTGICASAVAAVLNRKADMKKQILFHAKGGDIKVELDGTPDDIQKTYLIGPAQEVYTGKIEF
ncbi:MAG: diaminopimelate epimerase [Candidatus Altiarchaeota archaeon]